MDFFIRACDLARSKKLDNRIKTSLRVNFFFFFLCYKKITSILKFHKIHLVWGYYNLINYKFMYVEN